MVSPRGIAIERGFVSKGNEAYAKKKASKGLSLSKQGRLSKKKEKKKATPV